MENKNIDQVVEIITKAFPEVVKAENDFPPIYNKEGYFGGVTDKSKYLLPEYVTEYAEKIAKLLYSVSESDLSAMYKDLKQMNLRTLPHGARKAAVAELIPEALLLVSRKKAPLALVGFIKTNLNMIHNDDDWCAFLHHIKAVRTYHTALHSMNE